jgi:hypothetical protein
MLTFIFVLFIVYALFRAWTFSKNKEWKDLIVFVLISGFAAYFMLLPSSARGLRTLVEYTYGITGSLARQLIPTIFGVEI